MRELISKLSSRGREANILFHVDEHRNMCKRTSEVNDPGASFSKGAMETLAACGTVVATYIDKPDFLNAYGTSSDVCRYPIGLPPIDIENLMKEYKLKDDNENHYHPFQFPFDKKILDPVGERLLATLKFKVAVKCTSLDRMPHVHYPSPEFKLFCKDFKDAMDKTKIYKDDADDIKLKKAKKILEDCGKECSVELKVSKNLAGWKNCAIELFLGVTEAEYEEKLTKERYENLMVLDGGVWTFTFIQLLTLKKPIISDATQGVVGGTQVVVGGTQGMVDGTQGVVGATKRVADVKQMVPIFFQGQKAMKNIIGKPDYLSNTPLEIAYRWVLPILLSLSNTISSFDNFSIAFEDTSMGRIFDGGTAIEITDALIEKKVKPYTFYYVEEGKGITTHPLFDFFFLCEDDATKDPTLILIDVTGGGIMTAEDKLEKISNWIKKQKLDKFVLKGFVLAPGANMENKTDDSENAAIIGQVHALELLGGLKQIFRWLIEDQENVLQRIDSLFDNKTYINN